MLIGAILNVLNSVIANPSLLESSSESSTYAPSGEVIRQQNEIRHMMDAAQLDYDRTKSEILRLSQMQYDCCTWKGRQHIAFSSLMPTAARVFEEIPPLMGSRE